ncbi:MAG: glycosyltransferase family 4 protein [Candidatus Norongarragalinales archaeon]
MKKKKFAWKVVQLDNIANTAFHYAKYLRKAGMECDLLVEKGSSSDPATFMEERHQWVKYWTQTNPINKFFVLWKLTRDYDILHANGGIAVYAYLIVKLRRIFGGNQKLIAHSMGSDLRLVAAKNTLKDLLSGNVYLQTEWSAFENFRNILIGFLLRKSYKNCDRFFCFQPDQIPLIEKMGIKNVGFVFQIIDTEKFSPLKQKHKRKYLALFYPTRHSWKTKGNDRFLNAFAKFLKMRPDAKLKLVYWDLHKEKSRLLVKELKIEKSVTPLPLLKEKEIIREYRDADIVVDEFGIGSFGPISQEAMSCGKPVLRFIDEKLHAKFYSTKEKPPVENARSEEEILAGLLKLADKKYREKLGKKARQFILEYHDWKKATEKLVEEYKLVLAK